jgi:plasmid stabilization system protein ParE
MDSLQIAEGAEEDYIASLTWYSALSKQAADGFEAEFAQALEAIAESPGRYPLYDARHRSYLLRHYPFRIVYRKTGEHQCLIEAVAHTSRRPGYWRNR